MEMGRISVPSACIDMGSSYFRLLILLPGEWKPGQAAPQERFGCGPDGGSASTHMGTPCCDQILYSGEVLGERYMVVESRSYVGWGRSVSGKGALEREVVDDACGKLEFLLGVSRRFGCPEPVLVGTNVFREASNGMEVKTMIEDRVGMPVSVLTDRGEAFFGYLGASTAFDFSGILVVVDPGGTSMEVSLGRGSTMSEYTSLKVGTHKVSRDLGGFVRGYPGFRRGLIRYIDLLGEVLRDEPVLGGVSRLIESGEDVRVLLTGGTAVSMGALKGSMLREEVSCTEAVRMKADLFRLVIRRTISLYSRSMDFRLPVDRARRNLLLPGMVLLEAFVRVLRIGEMFVTARDLRWGVLLSGGRFDKRDILY